MISIIVIISLVVILLLVVSIMMIRYKEPDDVLQQGIDYKIVNTNGMIMTMALNIDIPCIDSVVFTRETYDEGDSIHHEAIMISQKWMVEKTLDHNFIIYNKTYKRYMVIVDFSVEQSSPYDHALTLICCTTDKDRATHFILTQECDQTYTMSTRNCFIQPLVPNFYDVNFVCLSQDRCDSSFVFQRC